MQIAYDETLSALIVAGAVTNTKLLDESDMLDDKGLVDVVTDAVVIVTGSSSQGEMTVTTRMFRILVFVFEVCAKRVEIMADRGRDTTGINPPMVSKLIVLMVQNAKLDVAECLNNTFMPKDEPSYLSFRRVIARRREQ